MSGRGYRDELPEIESSHVFVLRPDGIQPAHEPVVLDKPAIAGQSLGISFGINIFHFTGEDVLLLPCSLGGSKLREWMPSEPLYTAALTSALTAMRSGAELAGILWHQGESDSAGVADAFSYLKRLKLVMYSLLRDLREQTSANALTGLLADPLPVITAELGDYLDGEESSVYHRVINEQLHEFAALRPEFRCVRAHDLPDRGDRLHFSTQSLRRLGTRYADAWMEASAASLVEPAVPERVKAEYT